MKTCLALLCLILAVDSFAADSRFAETRFCGPPARDAKGEIARSPAVLTAFKKYYPCPATGKSTGGCPGWSIDHIVPLACGGCDAVRNLQWLPNAIKSCAGGKCKDRWERTVYETNVPCAEKH